ncbi:hypothetical protein JXB27_04095 [Candidatus Woesearchaeota archaeon]|nr:hypothetical protein [Candidatus Woesearchaeota archaeon]
MPERKLLVSDLTLEYEGLFDCADLFRLIDDWFKQNGYDKNEIKHIEKVREKGKFIDYEIAPFKKVSDYAQYDIDVRVLVNNMTNADVTKNKQKLQLNKGKVTIIFNALLVTDVSERWESKPFFFFLRVLFDKFIHKRYIEQYDKGLMTDVQNLHTELKGYLNLSRHTQGS